LKQLRTHKNLSQKDVAEHIGTSIRHYQGIEYGETNPGLDIASRLADLFNVSLDYLVGKTVDSNHRLGESKSRRNILHSAEATDLSFPERLKYYRGLKEVSQREVASKTGISLRTFQYYESGDQMPRMNVLIKFADYFRVSIDSLVGKADAQEVSAERNDKAEAAELLSNLIEKMSAESPDLVVRFRELQENIDQLEPDEIRALADGYAILTGMATKAVKERMRTKSRHGEL